MNLLIAFHLNLNLTNVKILDFGVCFWISSRATSRVGPLLWRLEAVYLINMILIQECPKDQYSGFFYVCFLLMIVAVIWEWYLCLFADDVSVMVPAPTFEELQILYELLLQSYINWFHKNYLMINIDKTEWWYFTIEHSVHQLVISHLDSVIISKNGTIFLGINFDKNLKKGMHIDSAFLASKRPFKSAC